MAREILIDRHEGLTRAALVVDGGLTDLLVEREGRRSRLGAVHRGRILRVLPGIDAAFVEIGESRAGFLPLKDVRAAKAGHMLTLQVRADATRDKGPALSPEINFAGRFLVHIPSAGRMSVSRRIVDEGVRQALKARIGALGLGSGWIVRSSAADAPVEALAAEAEHLYGQGRELASREATAGVGRLVDPPSPEVRALLEWAGAPVARIVVEGEGLTADLRRWCKAAAPDLLDRIEANREAAPLFERGDLEGEIAALLGRRAPVPGGGWLSIEPTEALVAIDVNAGERQNALETNVAAAGEIARQLRLRNLGGVVVADFINMPGRTERERLLDALRRAVADDPAGTHIYGMTALGLVEMTRTRRGPSLAEALTGGPASPSDETDG